MLSGIPRVLAVPRGSAYPLLAPFAVTVGIVGGLAFLWLRKRESVWQWPTVGVTVALLVLLAMPAPSPGDDAGFEGFVIGEATVRVEGSDQIPVQSGGGSVLITTRNGSRALVLDCPDGCYFRAGSRVQPGTRIDFVSTTVDLKGGPLLVEHFRRDCRWDPLILNLDGPPCTRHDECDYRAPAGTNGTTKLEARACLEPAASGI